MARLGLFLLLLTLARPAVSLTLIDDGVPQCALVVAPDAPDGVRVAARELQRVLRRMSGAEVPIVAPGEEGTAARILIGDAPLPEGPALDLKGLGHAGYLLRVTEREVILRGATPAGTANAVYGFLQDHLGVRWFFPTDLFEVVPPRATVTVAPMDERHVPSFVCRFYSGLDDAHSHLWAQHLRLDAGGWEVPYKAAFSHWLYRVFPPSQWGAAHPEYYPLLNGQRAVPETDSEQLAQPCTSNPEAVQVAVATIRRYFDENPQAHTYSLSINDNNTWCACEACQAQDVDRPRFRGRPIYSDRYYTFVNAVARELRKTHPDKFVGGFAYAGVEPPPLGIERMEPNVFLNLTQDSSQYYDPEYRAEDYRLIDAWLEKCEHFGKYDYYGLGALVPRYFPHLLAADLKAIHAKGLEAFHAEAYPYWPNFGPQIYLAARLLWDVDLDPDALLDEFFAQLFGPAAEEMKGFYGVFETAWNRAREGRWFEGISSIQQQVQMFTPEDVWQARRHLSRALRWTTGDADVRARILYIARGYRYSELLLRGWQAAQALRTLTLDSERQAARAAKLVQRLSGVLQDLPAAWQESILDDPIMPGWYKQGARESVRGQWEAACQGALAQALPRLLAWYEAHGQADTAAALWQQASAAGQNHLALLLRALRGEFDEGPNLVTNPGFEETGESEDHPAGPEWVGQGAPPGWSTWQEDPAHGAFFLDREPVHSGQFAAAIRGGGVLCYITTVPLETGRPYVAQAWARAESPGEGRRTTLEVRWHDAQGRWFNGAPTHAAEVSQPGTWERLVVPFTAPEGAARAVLLLVAYGLPEGETVWFDDVAVVPVE